ncbi:MAG: valine--tRNA ligase, partial [Sporichthyaceae bacterium]|nr:valine--tRNA ligase [Sporichthyaceae bacterium]
GRDTVVRQAWPVVDPARMDDAAEAELAMLQRIVTEVRRFRADQGLKPGQRVEARFQGLASTVVAGHEPLIRSLVRLDEPSPGFVATATLTLAGGVRVELDTRATIDVAAERTRLSKDRAAAERDVTLCRAKLDDPSFVDRAPAPVVSKTRDRLAEAEADLVRITAALAALAS